MGPVLQWFIATVLLLSTASPVRSYFTDIETSIEETDGRVANASSVFFELYTRQNPIEPQILRLDDLESLQQSYFDASRPTKMAAHGYNGDPGTFNSTKDEFLLHEDCNFFTINWVELASGIDYPLIIIRNLPLAAKQTGAFVDFLHINAGAPLSSFHLIGFSLGAHVVGGAGAAVVSGTLPRITGLDPAAPGFSVNDTETRLDTTDADFVDIIHTNSGPIYLGEVSMLEAIGHVDFYPNGGQRQPGCFAKAAGQSRGCNHSRAVMYFDESISSDIGFRAVRCDTFEEYEAGLCNNNPTALMGEPTPTTTRGVYYLATNDVEPYAMG